MKKIIVISFVVIVFATAITIGVIAQKNHPGDRGYPPPPITATSTIMVATNQDNTTEVASTAVPTLTSTPSPTPTSTQIPVTPVANGGMAKNNIEDDLNVWGIMTITKLWGEKEVEVTKIFQNKKGEVVSPIGKIGLFEHKGVWAFVCHKDYATSKGSKNDVCSSLSSLLLGDIVEINLNRYEINNIFSTTPDNWWGDVADKQTTLTSCYPGSWNQELGVYSKLLVIELTPVK